MPEAARPAVFLLSVVAACRHAPPLPTVARAEAAMGRTVSIAAWGPDSASLARAVGQAFDSVRFVDSLLSPSDDSSELSRLRRGAGRGARPVSPAIAAMLRAGLAIARRSHGAFDPSRGSYRAVTFDSVRGTVALGRGMTLDFGELARGYALDRALRALAVAADSAVLDLGGLYLIHSPAPAGRPGSGRRVGVVDPDNSLATVALIELPSGTWSVSSTSAVEDESERLDPRTGKPSVRARAVTTVARDGLTAGAWSAALFVLGCDSALALAPQLDRVGVLCVDQRVRWSAALEGRVITPDSAVAWPAGTAPAPAPGRAPPGARVPSGSTRPPARSDSSR